MDNRLLAKKLPINTKEDLNDLYLYGHLKKTATAGQKILKTVGERVLTNIGLRVETWLQPLEESLETACLVHDVGKANNYFQDMIRGKIDLQPVRHEILSAALLLREQALFPWIVEKLGEETLEYFAVVGAISGHHLKFENWEKAVRFDEVGGFGDGVKLNLEELSPLFGGLKEKKVYYSFHDDHINYFGKFKKTFYWFNRKWEKELANNPEVKKFAAVLKSFLMAADVVASAKLGGGVYDWIEKNLNKVPETSDLEKVVEEKLQGNQMRPFQKEMGKTKGRVTVIEAGCGSGKTIGAYHWASKSIEGKKLFFCYPTTGTATEGFLDYVADPGTESELIHSRAHIDLEELYKSEEGPIDQASSLGALKTWRPAITVCTADTVLGLIRNNRKALISSPAILRSAFIFDEVHSYDDQMFNALLVFMKTLSGTKFLLMSASLPDKKLTAIKETVGSVEKIPTPRELEKIPRYSFHLSDEEKIWETIIENKEAKILWVVNTVGKAQKLFSEARKKGLRVINYHSRFKYKDRVERQRDLISSFENEKGVLAITTQVAEMSLDIDADILITEYAPIPSLIQRLGRLNRRVTPDNPGKSKQAIFYKPESLLPYEEEELLKAGVWLDRLKGKNSISQSDLAKEHKNLEEKEELRIDWQSEWLDRGWRSDQGPVREPGFTVNIILEKDLGSVREKPWEILKFSIPVPYKNEIRYWRFWRNHFIAPEGVATYSSEEGIRWK